MSESGPIRQRGSRILVVDDDVDTASGLARLLKLLGHDVRMAHTGTMAISQAATFSPEYILLDIGLPDIDGYQVTRRLRAEGLYEAVIIAITGRGEAEDLRKSREAGLNYHLVKPVEYNALMSLISGPTS